MSFALPISAGSALSVGTYKFYFKDIADLDRIPNIALPLNISLEGKTVQISQTEKVSPDRFVITITIIENPIPVLVILLGIGTLLGLTLGFLSLEKVEKIIDNPVAEFAVIGLVLLAIFFLVRSLAKR
jgi:hypothetical protein